MNDFIKLALALVVGFATGLFFFTGLWWTVRKGVNPNKPAIFLASFSIRMATVFAIVFAFRRDWKELLLLLAGFIAARLVVVSTISRRQPRL